MLSLSQDLVSEHTVLADYAANACVEFARNEENVNFIPEYVGGPAMPSLSSS